MESIDRDAAMGRQRVRLHVEPRRQHSQEETRASERGSTKGEIKASNRRAFDRLFSLVRSIALDRLGGVNRSRPDSDRKASIEEHAPAVTAWPLNSTDFWIEGGHSAGRRSSRVRHGGGLEQGSERVALSTFVL